MRKISVLLVVFLLFAGCSYIYVKNDEGKVREYSKIEIILSDFSKKVTAYYEKQNILIPKSFDEKQFIEVLKKVYPDQTKVELIKKDFKIKARPTDNSYSVVLCNPDTGNKLIEDLSCTLSKVDIRFWDKEGNYPCTFEENWEVYCKWKLGEDCTKKVSKLLSKGIPKKSIGNLRKMVKAELKDEITEIDGIVRGILKI